jgi:K+-transporting ATPase KdpF subunit
MNWMPLTAGGIAVALLAYLLVALLKPEKFS